MVITLASGSIRSAHTIPFAMLVGPTVNEASTKLNIAPAVKFSIYELAIALEVQALIKSVWIYKWNSSDSVRLSISIFSFVIALDNKIYFFPRMFNTYFGLNYLIIDLTVIDYLSIVRWHFFFLIFYYFNLFIIFNILLYLLFVLVILFVFILFSFLIFGNTLFFFRMVSGWCQ